MPSVQQLFIDQLKTALDALVTAGTIKRCYTEPTSIGETAEFPYCFFRIAADEEYELEGTQPFTVSARSRMLVTIAVERNATYATKELADIIAVLRQHLMTTWSAGTGCTTTILAMRIVSDPLVANLYGDFAAATLGIDYSGIDQY